MTEVNKPRLRWACRRGMLELDLILLPFFETQYNHLSSAEQAIWETFLTEQDQDLYAWLLNFQTCAEPHYQSLLLKIQHYVSHRHSS